MDDSLPVWDMEGLLRKVCGLAVLSQDEDAWTNGKSSSNTAALQT